MFINNKFYFILFILFFFLVFSFIAYPNSFMVSTNRYNEFLKSESVSLLKFAMKNIRRDRACADSIS